MILVHSLRLLSTLHFPSITEQKSGTIRITKTNLYITFKIDTQQCAHTQHQRYNFSAFFKDIYGECDLFSTWILKKFSTSFELILSLFLETERESIHAHCLKLFFMFFFLLWNLACLFCLNAYWIDFNKVKWESCSMKTGIKM